MLRINEIYHSFQGEGPNTGRPTMFVRFVGCNLKCPGWPCDSQHAIDPKLYRTDMQVILADDLTQKLEEELREGEGICFTGGEVFLQPAQDLQSVLSTLKHHTGVRTEVFTNGTLPWLEDMHMYFDNIIMDWKLTGSGENGDNRNVWQNMDQLKGADAIKFTIKHYEDFTDAARRWEYLDYTREWLKGTPQVWAGPVWGFATAEEVAQWIMNAKLPWNLNVQVHKFVWDPNKRGT